MRDLIISWDHPTSTVASLAGAVAGGLKANGVEAVVCNLQDRDQINVIGAAGRGEFKRIILMGALPLLSPAVREMIYERFDASVYFWVLDPIIYDLARMPEVQDYFRRLRQSRRLFVLFPDRSYMTLTRKWVGKNCLYFPFGTTASGATNALEQGDQNPDRSRRALVLANIGQELHSLGASDLRDIVARLDPFRLSKSKQAQLVDHVMNDERTSNVAVAVRDVLRLDAKDVFKPEVVGFLCAVDSSEKRRRRLMVLKSVKSVPLDVIGTGWKALLGPQENVALVRDSVSHLHLKGVFEKYRVLLDFAPNWDDGFNDRVLPCLHAGCRVVTSTNTAVQDLGAAGALVSTYSIHRPALETQLIEAIGAPEVEAQTITAIEAAHSWSVLVRKAFL